jgi:hypothetical protein
MVANPRTFGEVDGFITMLLAACEDRGMNETLEMLLSQPDTVRRTVVYRLLDRLKANAAPASLIDAVACLLDDAAAEKAYEVIYQCAKRLK